MGIGAVLPGPLRPFLPHAHWGQQGREAEDHVLGFGRILQGVQRGSHRHGRWDGLPETRVRGAAHYREGTVDRLRICSIYLLFCTLNLKERHHALDNLLHDPVVKLPRPPFLT